MIASANSIRQKLNRIVLAAIVASLLLAGLALAALDLVRQLRTVRSDLGAQADVLALASTASLSFSDPQAAAENLSSLQAKRGIAAAALYDREGRLFAVYLPSHALKPPTLAPPMGSHLDLTYLDVVRPVKGRSERLGAIYIRAEHGLLPRLGESLVGLATVMALSLVVGYIFSNRLQRYVTGPIMAISGVARQILRGDTHALRAEKTSNDEVGELVDAFNAMLAELGARADRLEESNRAKDRFLATLAHELRNPLAPIRTGLEILKKDTANGPASQRARATMERQLAHMIHLINDLLDIARVNTGKFNLERSHVPLRSVIDAAVEACRPGLDGRMQRLSVSCPTADLLVDIDLVRMTQALGNLIGNASKYTPEGGMVLVEAATGPEGVVLAVQDTGVGIPPDALEDVFELFAQVTSAKDRSQGGLGIGLFLVRSVVELHGGTVTAASAGTDQGARFTIRLPSSVLVQAPANAPGVLGQHASEPERPRRILVVDDNVDAAQTLASMLQMLGHTTQVACGGEEALALVPGFKPEVVVLDIGMPGMDGYEVARRIRASGGPSCPMLVAATGWGSPQDRDRAMAAGFDAHLTKPIAVHDLEAMIA